MDKKEFVALYDAGTKFTALELLSAMHVFGEVFLFSDAQIGNVSINNIVPIGLALQRGASIRFMRRLDSLNGLYFLALPLREPMVALGLYAHAYGERLADGVLFTLRPVNIDDPEMVGVVFSYRFTSCTAIMNMLLLLSLVVSHQYYYVDYAIGGRESGIRSITEAYGWADAVRISNELAEMRNTFVHVGAFVPPWADEMDIQPKTNGEV